MYVPLTVVLLPIVLKEPVTICRVRETEPPEKFPVFEATQYSVELIPFKVASVVPPVEPVNASTVTRGAVAPVVGLFKVKG